jgi:hypothetical protein
MEDNNIVDYISQLLSKDNNNLRYHFIANPKRSPRRHPLIAPNLRRAKLLLSQSEVPSDTPRLYLSNLPKLYRAKLRPQDGHSIVDFDLNKAHISIAAYLSKDPKLLKDIQKDIHQTTGDHFAYFHLNPSVRRKFGKTVNSAIIMGITPFGIQAEYKSVFGDNPRLPPLEHIEDMIQDWWKTYPKLYELRQSHAQHINKLIKEKQPYQIKYGRNLATYSHSELEGNRHNQPKKSHKAVLRSTWSAFITAYEAAIMEHVFVLAHQHGMKMSCPMYDGMMCQIPKGKDTQQFEDSVSKLLQDWEMPMGFTIKNI